MNRRKQDGSPPRLEPEIEKLLSTPDEQLLREAEEQGYDVQALVTSMKLLIADKLSEVEKRMPRDATRRSRIAAGVRAACFREHARMRPGDSPLRIALDHDIASLDLGPVSFLAILQHRWSEERAAEVEQAYRCWLQSLRDFRDQEVTPNADVGLYWLSHQERRDIYQEQMQKIFKDRPPRMKTPVAASRRGTMGRQGRWKVRP